MSEEHREESYHRALLQWVMALHQQGVQIMATVQQLQTSVDALIKAQADQGARLQATAVPDAIVAQIDGVTAALNAEIPAQPVPPAV